MMTQVLLLRLLAGLGRALTAMLFQDSGRALQRHLLLFIGYRLFSIRRTEPFFKNNQEQIIRNQQQIAFSSHASIANRQWQMLRGLLVAGL
jgi:hypothetical protein